MEHGGELSIKKYTGDNGLVERRGGATLEDRQRERENKSAFLSAGKSQQERAAPARGGVEPSNLRVKDLILYRLS